MATIKIASYADDISVYENEMQQTSIPYRDSRAFQEALKHIKKTNLELYSHLLEMECRECGVL